MELSAELANMFQRVRLLDSTAHKLEAYVEAHLTTRAQEAPHFERSAVADADADKDTRAAAAADAPGEACVPVLP